MRSARRLAQIRCPSAAGLKPGATQLKVFNTEGTERTGLHTENTENIGASEIASVPSVLILLRGLCVKSSSQAPVYGNSDYLSRSISPVMSRCVRWKVTYAQAQSKSTTKRFRNPMRNRIWTKSQVIQAK